MKLIFSLLVSLSSLLFASQAIGAVKLVEVNATGSGPTEDEAIANALARAVAQSSGAQASLNVSTGQTVAESKSTVQFSGVKSETSKTTGLIKDQVTDGKTTESGSATATTSTGVKKTPDSRISASGKVASYEVLSSKKRSDGLYEVSIKAQVQKHVAATYSAPGSSASGKRRIAVLEPSTNASTFDFFGRVPAYELADRLWTATESALVRAGTVSVLDRKTLNQSLKELNLVSSRLTNEEERAKLKKIRGADVVLMSTILDAKQEVEVSRTQVTGQVSRTETSYMEVEMRAVVPATSEILFSEIYRISEVADRNDAVNKIASRSAADLAFKLTGKRGAAAFTSTDITPVTVTSEQDLEPVEPRTTTGVKLPFDR